MDAFSTDLNNQLMSAYHSIGKLEEMMLKNTPDINLSISELHLLEAIGASKDGRGRTISDLAQELDITLPSVTVAIKKLEKKGYVKKVRCDNDARRVYVTLTRLGQRMEAMHRYFHRQMLRALLKTMDEGEKEQLFRAMQRLNAFIKHTIEKMHSDQNATNTENEETVTI